MHQGNARPNTEITVDENNHSSVDERDYLGSKITKKTLNLNDEISKWIDKATINLGLLTKNGNEKIINSLPKSNNYGYEACAFFVVILLRYIDYVC